jgi:hypothetical protein
MLPSHLAIGKEGSRQERVEAENKKGSDSVCESEPLELILAATYVPTQLPVQYHRPGGA